MANRKPQITTRPYNRSHGKAPQGNGGWAFQRSTTEVAFDADLYGDILFTKFGTLTECRKAAQAAMPDATWIAVLS